MFQNGFLIFLIWRLGLPTILTPEISAGVISARMFHHGNILACSLFGTADIQAHACVSTQEHFNMGTLRQGDFSARVIFGTETFRLFQHRGCSVTCMFGHWNFSAWRFYSIGNFWYGDISPPGFSALGIFMAGIFWHSTKIEGF